MDLGRIRSFLSIKILLGVALLLYALYSAVTEIPNAWKKFSDAGTTRSQLESTKQNYGALGTKLNTISAELDKTPTKIVQVEDPNEAQLAIFDIVQKIVQMSDASHNTYISLSPAKEMSINFENSVNLPITIPGAAAPAMPAPGTPVTPTPSANPPGAPVAPAVPGQAPAGAEAATLRAFEYQLQLKGTYANLSQFIYQLCRYRRLVIVNAIEMKPDDDTLTNPNDKTKKNPDEIKLTLTFLVPWQIGQPLPDEPLPTASPAVTPPSPSGSTQSTPSSGVSASPQTSSSLTNASTQTTNTKTVAVPQYSLINQPGAGQPPINPPP